MNVFHGVTITICYVFFFFVIFFYISFRFGTSIVALSDFLDFLVGDSLVRGTDRVQRRLVSCAVVVVALGVGIVALAPRQARDRHRPVDLLMHRQYTGVRVLNGFPQLRTEASD